MCLNTILYPYHDVPFSCTTASPSTLAYGHFCIYISADLHSSFKLEIVNPTDCATVSHNASGSFHRGLDSEYLLSGWCNRHLYSSVGELNGGPPFSWWESTTRPASKDATQVSEGVRYATTQARHKHPCNTEDTSDNLYAASIMCCQYEHCNSVKFVAGLRHPGRELVLK